GSNSLGNNTGQVLQPVIDGITEQTAFGNNVKVEMFERLSNGTLVPVGVDLNNPNQAFAFTDETSRFKIQVKAGYFQTDGSSDGPHTFVLRATDAAGVVGESVTINYTLNTKPVIQAQSVRLDPNGPLPADQGGSDSGLSFTDRITKVTNPSIDGSVLQVAPVPIQIFDVTNSANPVLVATGQTNAQGNFAIQIPNGVYRTDGSTDGPHTLRIVSPRQPVPSDPVDF